LLAHCYTDRQLSVISTCVNGQAQTPLGNLLKTYYTNKFATNSQEIELKEIEH